VCFELDGELVLDDGGRAADLEGAEIAGGRVSEMARSGMCRGKTCRMASQRENCSIGERS
jgi:hypothetical protein